MVFSLLTVVFYTASSLGDKYISAKLACSAQEFSFLVALSTAFFLTLVLPFTGWNFAFSLQSGLALVVLVALKIAEFYTSAALLKTVSAYELKAWLSLNVIISYLVDLARGTETFFWAFLPCAAVLVAGIGLVAFGEKREKLLRYILLSLIYVASKFLYGLQMNVLEGTSPVCVLQVQDGHLLRAARGRLLQYLPQMVPRYARGGVPRRPVRLGTAGDGGRGQTLPGNGDRRGRAVRLPQPLCDQVERRISGKDAQRAARSRPLL